ncbi:MAG: class I SAM-dependent rRNA methyltransferase [Planctomycetota bacterium]|nr:class I SAM-dependent rRNA methyltransferase [Planctomycetota bacterium]
MAVLTLNKKRLRRDYIRHPWVYHNSVEATEGTPKNGDVVELRRPDGRFLAWGFINHNSKLFVRMYTFDESEKDAEKLFRKRCKAAIALRRDVLKLDERANAYRVLHSEGDGIPGIIADRYGDYLVVSCTSLGTYKLLEKIAEELATGLGLKGVFEVGASKGIRGIEGLPPGRGVIWGEAPPEELSIEIDGVKQKVKIAEGQKTGLFLDQRNNIRRFADLCEGQTVLDACCYGGSFGLVAALRGAESVEAFDVSSAAVELARGNAILNGLEDKITIKRGDLFTELRAYREAGKKFTRIVLDPPNFAGSKRDIGKAKKAYVAAHSLALKILEPGGLLLSFTCSHHITGKIFEETVLEATRRESMSVQVLERLGAGSDHPSEIFCPEGRYLNGIIVRLLG